MKCRRPVRLRTAGGLILFLLPMFLVSPGCSRAYPYLIVTDNCQCERYRHESRGHGVAIEFWAEYSVNDRITSVVNILFRNQSRDTLSLKQAFIKGTSRNIRYQNNDRFVPLPFVEVPPGEEYPMTLSGSDVELVEEPWFKVAGERVRVELRGLLIGGKVIDPVVVELVPVNPKVHS
jgi:hypothetical protein